MGKFVAAEAVEALEFDLAPYGPAGCVPEPSQDTLQRYLYEIGTTVEKARKASGDDRSKVDKNDPVAVMAELAKMDPKEIAKQNAAVVDALAHLCGAQKINAKWQGGRPTHADLKALPARPLQAFMGWLMGELYNPETGAVDSTPMEGESGGEAGSSDDATSD